MFLQLKPFRPTLIPIEQDQHGMIPHALRRALEEWKIKCNIEGGGYKMPKLMYINATGTITSSFTLINKLNTRFTYRIQPYRHNNAIRKACGSLSNLLSIQHPHIRRRCVLLYEFWR